MTQDQVIAAAMTCDLCSGTGRIKEPFICKCGGYGRLIPGEDLGMGIG
jgi:DnaJ-class molecular chaperone